MSSKSDPLPPGWTTQKSRSTGRIYYCNHTTGQSTFDRNDPMIPKVAKRAAPASAAASAASAASSSSGTGAVVTTPQKTAQTEAKEDDSLPPGWTTQKSRSTGRIYYCNYTTGQSTFDRNDPMIPKVAKRAAPASAAASAASAASSSSGTGAVVTTPQKTAQTEAEVRRRFQSMTLAQLKTQCADAWLSQSGTREQLIGRLVDYEKPAGGWPSVSQTNPTAIVQPSVAISSAPSKQYTVKLAAKVRAGFETSSADLGVAHVGEVITEKESRVNAAGTIRVRYERGWISMKTADGRVILEPYDAVPPAPVRTAGTPTRPGPANSDNLPGPQYTVKLMGRVRSGFEQTSSEQGVANIGEVITELESRINANGIKRVRFSRGWISAKTADGRDILTPHEAPLPPGWTTQQSRSTGRTYYVNHSTGQSTFDRNDPMILKASAVVATPVPAEVAPSDATEAEVKGKYMGMTWKDLRHACMQKGLTQIGSREQLIERLVASEQPVGGWGSRTNTTLSGISAPSLNSQQQQMQKDQEGQQHRFLPHSAEGGFKHSDMQQRSAAAGYDGGLGQTEHAYVEQSHHLPLPQPVKTVRTQMIMVGQKQRPWPTSLAWTQSEGASLELPVESSGVDEEIVKSWADGLRDGCVTAELDGAGARRLASWSRRAREHPRPVWDRNTEVDHALMMSQTELQQMNGKNAAAMVRLGRPWRTDSKVDSGQGKDKDIGTAVDVLKPVGAQDPKNIRAVPTMEAVLEWHARCDRSYSSSRCGWVQSWSEKREWECSALEWLQQRARVAVKQTLQSHGYRQDRRDSTEDLKLWQEQMATNFKEGNLDLNDLSDVSSLPTLLKLLAIEHEPDLTDEVLSTLTGIAKGAKSLPEDSNDWCALLEGLLVLVEPPARTQKPETACAQLEPKFPPKVKPDPDPKRNSELKQSLTQPESPRAKVVGVPSTRTAPRNSAAAAKSPSEHPQNDKTNISTGEANEAKEEIASSSDQPASNGSASATVSVRLSAEQVHDAGKLSDRPAWDASLEINTALDEPLHNDHRSRRVLKNPLGRRWRAESKVDTGQVHRRNARKRKIERPAAKDMRAVAPMEAVLEWHKRCEGGKNDIGRGDTVRPWDEKREWECSPLEWLQQRARVVVKKTLSTHNSQTQQEQTANEEGQPAEDLKLWQEQMATNFKEGNLDLNDLSDVSSLPTLLKLLAIEHEPDLTGEVLSTLTGIAKGAKSLPEDSNDWCALLEGLLVLVEPPSLSPEPPTLTDPAVIRSQTVNEQTSGPAGTHMAKSDETARSFDSTMTNREKQPQPNPKGLQQQLRKNQEEKGEDAEMTKLKAVKDQTDKEVIQLQAKLAELEARNRALAQEETSHRERCQQLELRMVATNSYSEDTALPVQSPQNEAQQSQGQLQQDSETRSRRTGKYPFLRRSGGLQASDGIRRPGNWPRRHWLQATAMDAIQTSTAAGSIAGNCSDTMWKLFEEAEKAFSENAWSTAAMAYEQVAVAVATLEATADVADSRDDDNSGHQGRRLASMPSLWRCYNRLGLARSKMAKAAAAAGGDDGERATRDLSKLAVQAYTSAIAVDGQRAESFSNRGWKHLGLGLVEEAKRDAEEALRRDATSRQAQKLLQKITTGAQTG